VPQDSFWAGLLLRPSQSATGPARRAGVPRKQDCEPLNAIDPSCSKSLADVLRYRRLTLLYTVTQVIHVEYDSRCPITA
jgi:hypothetical protein